MSVIPSPTMTIFSNPNLSFRWRRTLGFPPASDVGQLWSNPAYRPEKEGEKGKWGKRRKRRRKIKTEFIPTND